MSSNSDRKAGALSAEAEADAFLKEHDSSKRPSADGEGEGDFDHELADLERDEGLRQHGAAAGQSEGLPVPNTQSQPVAKMHPAPVICIWIVLSSTVILMNAYILKDLGFDFPVTLTTLHLAYASLGTRLLRRFTHLLDGLDRIDMSWDRYLRNIVPIGALFSASLVFSNLAYITLEVSFIQMLKAFVAVVVYFMSVFMGLEQYSRRTASIVLVISSGVAIASYGEINFVLSGFIAQCLGILFEATRLVAIQKLLQGLRMDPLVSLHYYAPVCFFLNALLIPIVEGPEPLFVILERVGFFTLALNVNVAFLLNVSVVFLIGCASSLVLTLSGVIKDILLVSLSVVLFGSTVTLTQLFGYAIALAGLVIFKTKKDVMDTYIHRAKELVGLAR